MSVKYHILAYYAFVSVDHAHEEVKRHKEFCEQRDIKGRLYISEQGINGQMSASVEDSEAYQQWMAKHSHFKGTPIKIHPYHEHVFEKLTIKYRKQLCALDKEVDLALTGEHVSPSKWREMLESGKEKILIDVRNDYETAVGHFEGAETPALKTFREFRQYAEDLKNSIDPRNTPVMMYCTGGIRCELYSAYLKQKGFKKVYQLDGGVIQYGLDEGSKHWLGKLFVFDDRMTAPICDEETPVIGKCHQCGSSAENYYNCANMDCNELFISCPDCLKKQAGCCQKKCRSAPRVRPYQQQNPHKPFRKRYRYFKSPSQSNS